MNYPYGCNEDYLDEDDDGIMYSTRNYCSDSDDETLAANFLQKRFKKNTLARKVSKKENGSDDDFEKEMASELSMTMQKLTAPYLQGSSAIHIKNEDLTVAETEFYDDIYFDSDGSEPDDATESTKAPKPRPKNRILSNDELLYDPDMDDEDQAWVDKQRRSYQLQSSRRLPKCESALKPKPLPHSDAVLNCPACFTTLCLDCQRHEIYKDQYRAMFVFNCVVDASECLYFSKKNDKKKKFKKTEKRISHVESEEKLSLDSKRINANSETVSAAVTVKTNTATISTTGKCTDMIESKHCTEGNWDLLGKEQDLSENNHSSHESAKTNADNVVHEDSTLASSIIKDEDKFRPVKCTVCGTKVAVYDKDEVYHFFNIITSY